MGQQATRTSTSDGRAHERPSPGRQGRGVRAQLRDAGGLLQTFGGSGFLQDYPLEQYIRDAKIDTLYEGTTAIQGLDFFFRKMVRDQFKSIFYLAAQITETVKGDEGKVHSHGSGSSGSGPGRRPAIVVVPAIGLWHRSRTPKRLQGPVSTPHVFS